ncbi:hypothetical protein D3C84_1094480 [compost metagenome]
MRTVTAQRHLCGIDRFHRCDGVALDAGYLHQATDRVTGQPKVVFQTNFRSVFHLLGTGAENFCQAGSGHRASRTDFALATHFSPGNRGIAFAQYAHRGSGE